MKYALHILYNLYNIKHYHLQPIFIGRTWQEGQLDSWEAGHLSKRAPVTSLVATNGHKQMAFAGNFKFQNPLQEKIVLIVDGSYFTVLKA
jgi:hypothetical protein